MASKTYQPTYKRQRFLLAFIQQLKDGATATDLQKLIFLYTQKENADFYEFIPYRFGPYSFQLTEDIDILCRDHYISTSDYRIRAIGEYQIQTLFSIDTERGTSLIRKAYREYPYYSINSEILSRLFQGTEIEYFRKERENYTQSEQMLFTIGYEGKSVEAFMNSLIQNDIRLLCDVRKNPLSRKFGFSKGKLQHIAERIGITYIHIPALGIESEKRSSLDTIDDYKSLFRDYEETLPNLKEPLKQVYSLLLSNNRIALMCYEKEPIMCHRHVIRDYLVQKYNVRSMDL